MAVSSRGQDTWFSATGPGFESPYRYQPSLTLANSRELRRGLSPGKPRKEQHRIGRANLLATSFETFERSIRDRASAVWIDCDRERGCRCQSAHRCRDARGSPRGSRGSAEAGHASLGSLAFPIRLGDDAAQMEGRRARRPASVTITTGLPSPRTRRRSASASSRYRTTQRSPVR